jgi:hypothetical protein
MLRRLAADERAGLRWLQGFRRRCDVVAVTDAALARACRPSLLAHPHARCRASCDSRLTFFEQIKIVRAVKARV